MVYCLDNKTFPIPLASPPCISVTKKACLDLTIELQVANKTIFGPKEIPLRLILQSPERGFCQTTDLLPGVVFCGNVTSMNYTEKDRSLNVCLTLSAEFKIIPGLPGTSKQFPIPCFNIKNCDFPKTCPNNCNGLGTCELGVCRCQEGHYGIDCGAQLKGNCIQQGPKLTCWNITEPTCRHIDVEVSETNKTKEHLLRLVMSTEAIDIQFPCTRNFSDLLQCVDCVSFTDVIVVGNQLKGKPSVSPTCGAIPLVTQKYPLTTLAELQNCGVPIPVPAPKTVPSSPTPPSPVIPKTPVSPVDPPQDEGWIDKAKENKGALIIGAVVIVVVLIALMGVGFYLYKRCSKQARTGNYQTVSSVDPFDGTPMQDDADAINYSFSSSDQESNEIA